MLRADLARNFVLSLSKDRQSALRQAQGAMVRGAFARVLVAGSTRVSVS